TNITPTSGSVGTVVTILTGNGYQALELVRVDFGNTASITQVSAAADGIFLTFFTVDTQKYGTTTAVAQGVTSLGSSSIGLKILPNIVSVSPSEGTVGTMITVTGDGFEAGQLVGISFGETPTIIQVASNENGSFTISFTADTQYYGTQAVKAYMMTNPSVNAEKPFFIRQTIDEVMPNRGTVGSMITVRGTGFDAADAMKLRFGTNEEGDIPDASSRGSFTATFEINTQPYGTTTIAIHGAFPSPDQGTSTTLIILPRIYSVLPAEGSVGTPVTVIGNGFVATDVVSITFGATPNIATATVGSNGLFTAYFTINTQPLGWTLVTASGTMTTMATSTCRIVPAITMISPQKGTVGTVVSIEGNGYNNNEQVNIKFGNNEAIATITAGITGTFATSFVVDTQIYGTTSVGAIGGTSQVPAQEKIFVILPAVVSVTPFTGTVGSLVTVYGNGYGSGHLIQVEFGTTPDIVQTTSDACGSWTAIFTVDTQRYEISTKITAKDNDITADNDSFTICPNIIISPTSGIVGSQVTVQGNGYGANDTVNIDFGITPNVVTPQANGVGVFSTSFTINLQPYGTTTIKGDGIFTPVIPEKPFNILSKVTGVTPAVGSITTMVTVTGNGFGQEEKIWVKFGATPSITSTTTDIYGSFTAVFSIDTQYYGTKTITVSGINSGRSDEGIAKVVARIYQVSPLAGTVGSTVTIWGDGYSQNETLRFKLGINDLTNLNGIPGSNWIRSSIDAGTFSVFFVVTTQSAGTTTITATGDAAKSGQVVNNRYYINGKILDVLPSIGTVGSWVTVTGNGFIFSDSVRIDFGQSMSITIASTSVNGTFSVGFTVDIKPMGTVTIIATDRLTTDSNSFRVKSALTNVTPTIGTVGTLVSVSGNGFYASEQIRIDFGSTITMTAVTADVDGIIGITFTIDEQQNGSTQINAIGVTTGATGTIGFSISHNLVSITPISGTVGSRITVYGNGYVPGTITIKFGDNPWITDSAINQNGSFTVGFTVDTQVYGSTTVTAQGTGGKIDTETYIILSHITQVSPLSGTVGTLVSVSGDGYGNDEQVRIGFGTNNTITIKVAGSIGSFVGATFTVDIQPSGTVTVTAAGLLDQVKHVDTDEYRIKGNITYVSPSNGTIGLTVTVTGNGFGANEGVQIRFGNNASIATAQAADVGTFSHLFTVDTQVYGTKTVKATGLTTNDISNSQFVLTPAIYLVTPINGTVGGTLITIAGNGYEAGAIIAVDFGTIQNVSGCNATPDGTFTTTFNLDSPQPYGSTTITAGIMNTLQIACNYFTILPRVYSVQPTLGSVGTSITVSGDGYGKSVSVQIDFGSTTGRVIGQTNNYGTFGAVFTIDTQVFGTTTIKALGTGYSAFNTCKIIPGIYSVIPSHGVVGQSISVCGNGYVPGDIIIVDFDGQQFNSIASADGIGQMTAVFTVPVKPYGTRTIMAIGNFSKQNAYNSFFIEPFIYSVVPANGTIGTPVTISGSGYGESGWVNIDFGTLDSQHYSTPQPISDKGTFSYTYDTFRPQPAGTTTIIVWQSDAQTTVTDSDTFFIKASIVTVSPNEGTVGTPITITGTGFSANYSVKIGFGTTASIISCLTDGSGTFTTIFTIDTQVDGTTTITGSCSINTATNSLKIKPAIILVTPIEGTVGRTVTVSGNGFGKSHTIRVKFGNTSSMVLTSSTSNGSFITNFTVDEQIYGSTQVLGYDDTDNVNASYQQLFTIKPNITLVSPKSGTVDTIVQVTGNGFGGGESVRIKFGTTETIATTLSTGTGYFETTFTVDNQSIGINTITAIGSSTGQQAATYTFRVVPMLTAITPASGTIGIVITISGTGYKASETVHVGFGTTPTIVITTAAGNGTLYATFTTNAQVYGTQAVRATGLSSGGTATINFRVLPHITKVSPSTGIVGTIVTVYGDGFGSIDTLNILFGTQEIVATRTTEIDGSFGTVTFVVGFQPFGSTTVTARRVSETDVADIDEFKILPNVTNITPATGTVGTVVTVYGTGFATNETIKVKFGSSTFIGENVPDASGTVTASFTVDSQAYGTTTVETYGTISMVSVYRNFIILPKVTIVSPIKGTVGTVVTIWMDGFAASESVCVTFGRSASITYATTGSMGTLSITFTVNTQPCGTTTITVTGTSSASNVFVIEPQITWFSPISGTVGSEVSIAGDGYGDKETVRIKFGNTASIKITTTSSEGSFSTTFIIDTQAYGTTTATAIGSS
ncbi:hypothetical protein HY792_07235, partial [Candidatus Desantisbacteria bacterium]|nr:hypothetical protein [Candidatus Desantisbacteria bacterium]